MTETQAITSFGFPFGTNLALKGTDYPSVTVTTGRITALRRAGEQLQQIQVDASLNPGNSGGPIVDEQGHVIGIVVAGIRGAALNFAIPVDRVHKLLAKPEIIFNPGTIPGAQQNREREFNIRVVSFNKSAPAPNVVLSLSSGQNDGRFFTARAVGDGTYVVRAVPVPPPTGPRLLIIDGRSADGSIVAKLRDRNLQVGPVTVKLSDVSTIENTPLPRVLLADGQTLTGKINGLQTVEAHIGAVPVTLDLGKLESMTISQAEPARTQLQYRVIVKQGNTVLNEKTGSVVINAAGAAPTLSPPAPSPGGGRVGPTSPAPASPVAMPSINPPNLAQERVTVKLPAAVEDVGLGAGGRYLILWLKRLHKLAIFDVSTAQVVKFLSIEADDIVYAAGMRKLIVVLNDQQIIQRWDLVTFERELTLPVQQGMRLQSMAAASGTTGPVLVAGADLRVFFLDPMTLQKMDIEISSMPWVGGHAFSRVEVRAARNGSVFTAWVPGSSIHGTYTITPVSNNKAETRFHRQWTNHAVPGPDGNLIYTDRGIISPEMQKISAERFEAMASLPLVDSSSYFISVGRGSDWGPTRVIAPPALYSANDRRLLLTLPEIPEIAQPERPSWNDSKPPFETLDKQVHLFAGAKVLLTISKTKDEIVLRRLDILDGMDKAGIDYLFIASSPVLGATKGRPYIYQLDVKSRRGGVSYKLDSGPPGMRLAPNGRLEWMVPANYEGSTENIILSVRDASGQEVFHSFKLLVQ